ncbi:Os10g0409732 [Oryza sativa Japonica Group]|uniref:Uncharacterized protein n=2 Tax=Oryza sativa subsp. japonica TaxID=39947 RepID=A0A8J8XKY9_ORYSJ|nr:hypothetical protein OsJ_31486 [Oryza sativa Japonica Group]BAT10799.1 Os10g0409732 [Oryza sativa Japonica Group]
MVRQIRTEACYILSSPWSTGEHSLSSSHDPQASTAPEHGLDCRRTGLARGMAVMAASFPSGMRTSRHKEVDRGVLSGLRSEAEARGSSTPVPVLQEDD